MEHHAYKQEKQAAGMKPINSTTYKKDDAVIKLGTGQSKCFRAMT
jgi:hypothetical protein